MGPKKSELGPNRPHFKFKGRGQRDSRATDAKGISKVIVSLPGQRINKTIRGHCGFRRTFQFKLVYSSLQWHRPGQRSGCRRSHPLLPAALAARFLELLTSNFFRYEPRGRKFRGVLTPGHPQSARSRQRAAALLKLVAWKVNRASTISSISINKWSRLRSTWKEIRLFRFPAQAFRRVWPCLQALQNYCLLLWRDALLFRSSLNPAISLFTGLLGFLGLASTKCSSRRREIMQLLLTQPLSFLRIWACKFLSGRQI